MARFVMTKEVEDLATKAVFHLQFRTARAARMLVEDLGISDEDARKAVDAVARPHKG